MAMQRYLIQVPEELGLVSIYKSPFDTKLLCTQRFVRLFAYGGSTLILVSYLSALGIEDGRIGLFMTLTLVGDVLISFCLTLVADGLGRRTILALGAALMAGSGLIFALSSNYWLLLAAAIFGVISPSGNEIGPFRAIEESTLAHLSPPEVRSDIFAWYSLIGTAGTAFGMITCGWVVRHLLTVYGSDDIRAYKKIFLGYAVIGLIKLALALALTKKCEADKPEAPRQPDPERAPLLGENAVGPAPEKSKSGSLASLFPSFSPGSKMIIINLCLIFALDSLGSGLVPLSWVTAFFKRKFHLQEGLLGTLFFTTSIIAATSMLVASSISKRIGNIRTMVFTHLPSAVALALIPIPNENQVHWAMLFLILRSCTQSMDVAPRSAFLAAVILPNERTAVMGMINVVKTFSSSIGPSITGLFAARGLFWISFLVAGSLKATYDLGVLALFAGREMRESKAKAVSQAAANRESEVQDGHGEEHIDRAP